MKRTSLELTDEQYFYLQEKALELRKKGVSACMASIIRELIEKDMKASKKKRGKGR